MKPSKKGKNYVLLSLKGPVAWFRQGGWMFLQVCIKLHFIHRSPLHASSERQSLSWITEAGIAVSFILLNHFETTSLVSLSLNCGRKAVGVIFLLCDDTVEWVSRCTTFNNKPKYVNTCIQQPLKQEIWSFLRVTVTADKTISLSFKWHLNVSHIKEQEKKPLFSLGILILKFTDGSKWA